MSLPVKKYVDGKNRVTLSALIGKLSILNQSRLGGGLSKMFDN